MAGLFSADAWSKIWTYRSTFLLGLENTALTAVFALALALVLGILFGLLATSGNRVLAFIARVYVEVIQNTPVLLQMCFLYYALAFSDHSIGIIKTGILTLGIYHGAYMAEVVRSGIESVPAGQFDAAHSQGFEYFGMMRYIILPQTVRIILPPMGNQVVSLIKNTSCLYIVGGADLIASTYNFVTGDNTAGAYGPAYLVSGLIFFVICYPLSMLAVRWEARLKKRTAARPAAQTTGKEATRDE